MPARPRVCSKRTTEDLHEINIGGWQPRGLLKDGAQHALCWSRREQAVARLDTCVRGDWILLVYRRFTRTQIPLVYHERILLGRTPCNIGGERLWLTCPSDACQRLVKSLFISREGFRCRHCLDLTYPSQREHWADRQFRKADAIRRKLGWELGFIHGLGPKPRNMHHQTYARLVRSHNRLVNTGARFYLQKFKCPLPPSENSYGRVTTRKS